MGLLNKDQEEMQEVVLRQHLFCFSLPPIVNRLSGRERERTFTAPLPATRGPHPYIPRNIS